MYHHNFILGQIIVAANQPAQIETCSCKENVVKLHTCFYDLTTREFKVLHTELAFIMLRGDNNQSFFSYWFDPDKSYVLYSTSKPKISDAFISTGFQKNIILKLLMREERNRSFPLYFIICYRSPIEKKQLSNIKTMSI